MHVQVSNPVRETTYRPDIDGLRAVAIVSVLLFHAFPAALPGGFVGVDVFFVISGYLISSQIMSEMQQGRFSFASFYARRARRLLPALLLVLTFCVIAGWFILLPSQYELLGRDTLAGLTFSSNIVFWSDAGYFDAPSSTKPLLHLWSLGIEEQFYLIWPIALVVAFRYQRIAALIGGVIAASLACNILLISTNHQDAAFYLPLSRFWELLAGAAIINVRTRSNVAAIAGAILIGSSLAFVREANFPGWQALLPVLGTVLLIAGGRETFVNRLLSHRIIVAIGLISYPLYMWHWPLLALGRIYNDGPLAVGQSCNILIASVIAAALTYLLIERPIRSSGHFLRRTALRLSALLAATVLACSTSVVASGGFPERIAEIVRNIDRYRFDGPYISANWRPACFASAGREIPNSCVETQPPNAPLVALWGDSNLLSLLPGVIEYQKIRHFRIAQLTSSSCPPIIDVEFGGFTEKCEINNASALGIVTETKPDILILGAAWWHQTHDPLMWERNVERFRKTVLAAKASGAKRIVIVGSLPFWPRLLKQTLIEFASAHPMQPLPTRTRDGLAPEMAAIDQTLARVAGEVGASFVSPSDYLCAEDGCLTRLSDDPNDLITFDDSHLTASASRYFVGRAALHLMPGVE